MRTFQAELLNQSIKYSTVYLTGLEAILTAGIDEQLAEKSTKNTQKVNRAVNAIKSCRASVFK